MYQRILVCLDSSERALAVARAAADIAVRYEAHALLLCVHGVESTEKLPYSALGTQSVINHQGEMFEKQSREASAIFAQRHVLFDVWHRVGNPTEVIVQTAKEQCMDLIVMGHREPKKWLSWLDSGIVERVSRQASCDVMRVTDALQRTEGKHVSIGGLGRESWGNLSLSE